MRFVAGEVVELHNPRRSSAAQIGQWREQQILDLVAVGRTQKETAFELGVSDATVRVLYSRAMKKLGRSKHRRDGRSVRP